MVNLLVFHDPIIEIVVQVTIALLEVQFFEGRGVLHQIQAVVHIAVEFLGHDQGIVDQLLVGHSRGEVQERIASLDYTQFT